MKTTQEMIEEAIGRIGIASFGGHAFSANKKYSEKLTNILTKFATEVENAVLEREAKWCKGKKIQTWDKAFNAVPKYGEHLRTAGNGDLLKRGYNNALQSTADHLRDSKTKEA